MSFKFPRLSLKFSRAMFVITAATVFSCSAKAQDLEQLNDSIRAAFQIPELGFAVVKLDTIAALQIRGFHRADQETTSGAAKMDDYFHLGSNTKAITAFIAARLVEQGKLKWTTKFFDLYPAWK